MIPIITIYKDSSCYYLGRDKTRTVAITLLLNSALVILVTGQENEHTHNRKLFFSGVGSLA